MNSSRRLVKGFSRLNRQKKVALIQQQSDLNALQQDLDSFRLASAEQQEVFDGFSENTLSNYHLPWGIVPNVLIDGTVFHVPVVTEESSVVAAASKAAAFWAQRGGFHTLQISAIKKGQLHFLYAGNPALFAAHWDAIMLALRQAASPLMRTMEARGGGLREMQLLQNPAIAPDYFQLDLQFETADSMGANFINTILEALGTALPGIIAGLDPDARVEVLMAILSNYTPHCKVSLQVSCPVEELLWSTEMLPDDFARRMMLAARIAAHDVSRAVTHNKGIMNGVDAVVLATGNDFRAVEASVHAYAARDGQYRSLSRVDIQDGQFRMELSLPLALGTVGGLTSLHPLAARSLEILGKPSALTLMKLAAALGLANNFAAMAALVTSGIQKGHMKMHLGNILSSLKVTDDDQRQKVAAYFQDKTVSVAAVKQFLGMD